MEHIGSDAAQQHPLVVRGKAVNDLVLFEPASSCTCARRAPVCTEPLSS